MTDRAKVKEFLSHIMKDDYKEANKVFPEVVKSSVQTLINNRKPEVIEKINEKAAELVSTSILDSDDEIEDKEKDQEPNKEDK